MKTIQITSSLAAGIAICALATAPVMAQNVIFHDHFNYPIGTFPAGPWGGTTGPEETPSGIIEVRQDTDNRFGRGMDNTYVYWSSNNESAAIRLDALNVFSVGAGPSIFTLSFEFIETTDPFASNPRSNRFALRTYAGTGFNNQLQQVDFRDLRINDSAFLGAGSGYSHDTFSRLDYVFNTTGDSINYDSPDGLVALAAESSDIWINGALVATGITITNAGSLTGFDLRNFSNNPGATFLIDDAAIFDGAVVGAPIPEPGTYALLFGGAALAVALVVRRRTRRQG